MLIIFKNKLVQFLIYNL